MASQNGGSEIPQIATVVLRWSTAVRGRSAAATPSGIATSAISSSAHAISSSDGGIRSRKSCPTGAWKYSDVPRSPRSKLPA